MSLNLADLLADLPPILTSSGEDELKFGRSTPTTDICGEDELKFGRSNLPILNSSGEYEINFGRSASRSTPSTDI